jgi:ubiquinone/menaquinone biosynthesis C-methylase UbiE
MISKLIKKFYNEAIEDLCTRILYFFNTIDSFFIFAGITGAAICVSGEVSLPWLMLFGIIAISSILWSDFHPLFILLSIPHLLFVFFLLNFPLILALKSLLICLGIVIAIQFIFMGLPDSIVGRDIKIAFIKIINSLPTIAPTTCSVSISLFFSWTLCLNLLASQNAAVTPYPASFFTLLSIIVAAGITRYLRPRTLPSKFGKFPPQKEYFKKVVLLNIDGCRFDYFKNLDMPNARRLESDGTSLKNGATTVYRALTNPAFASILTGSPPNTHGVKNNNFGQFIRTQGIPDIVQTLLYGSMHVKHFSKETWKTRIVSLPTTSIYGCDDVMVDWFKEDFITQSDTRFFVLDFSEADFLGHAYGSHSKNYKDAIQRVDRRIGDVVDWLDEGGRGDDTAIIVCSDHGMYHIDHSYLLFDEEKYVPFIVKGKGVVKGKKVTGDFSIMDIGLTVCFLLGVPYPERSRGKVLIEAIEELDTDKLKTQLANQFNQIHYDLEAKVYDQEHPEILAGDHDWYLDKLRQNCGNGGSETKKILDFGCGTGFIGNILIQNSFPFTKLVCLDSSEEMLEGARKKLNDTPNVSFVRSLEEVRGETFDVITINSVLHHFPDPRTLLASLENHLEPGGVIIGGHEPNIQFAQNALARLAARIYKNLGGAVAFPEEMLGTFNQKLRSSIRGFPRVDQEEIQQIVDWHSPTEQNRNTIVQGVGFNGTDFLRESLPCCDIDTFEEYTTFFCRNSLESFPSLQKLLERGFYSIFPGNLFRYQVSKRK